LIKGPSKLSGEVSASGSKNAALPLLAATLMLEGETTLSNVPKLLDISTMLKVLRALGLRAEYYNSDKVKIWSKEVKHVAPYELVTKMRASFFVIGPLLAKKLLAKVPLPGGCAIGSRPVDIHLKGLQALGAKIRMEHGFVIAQADELIGTNIYMDFPSVGATETIMMAATLATGKTIIENVAREPEIINLADFLNACGAKIRGAGTERIEIDGVKELRGANFAVIPDRIEALTLILAGAITRSSIVVKKLIPEHLDAALKKLTEAGFIIESGADWVKVSPSKNPLKSLEITTLPYPAFPTDAQAQFSSLLATIPGTSFIKETVFENRFMHVPELCRMGAKIKIDHQTAIIEGVQSLSGAPVRISDLRAGAALFLAGIVAEGETIVEDGEKHLERGYEDLSGKLISLGANIEVKEYEGPQQEKKPNSKVESYQVEAYSFGF